MNDVIKDIASEMGLFLLKPDVSRGSLFWLPAGVKLLRNLLDEVRKCLPAQEVITPPICSKKLWVKSGHLKHFSKNMFLFDNLGLKPMNCPLHFLLAKDMLKRGYKLPISLSEFSYVYRKEAYGAINSPLRNEVFCQDDSHVFLMEKDVIGEIVSFIEKGKEFYNLYFREVKIILALSPNEDVENIVRANALLEKGLVNHVDELRREEGAFYGPKIELHVKDSSGKEWQCGTIQLDLEAQNKFNILENVNVLHRALLGSPERFVGLLLQDRKGYLPFNLHPIPYAIFIFEDTFCDLLKGWPSELVYVGLKAIREGVKISRRSRSRAMVFVGRDEVELGEVRLQIYGQGETVISTLPLKGLSVEDLKREVDVIDSRKGV